MDTKPNDSKLISLEECAKHLEGLSLSEDEIEGIRDALYLIIQELVKDDFAQSAKSKLPGDSKSHSESGSEGSCDVPFHPNQS